MNKVMLDKYIMAIDPGASGGIAIYSPDSGVSAMSIPTDSCFKIIVQEFAQGARKKTVCYMEQVGGYIGDAKKSPGSAMFNFGNGYGFARGLLAANDVPCVLVPPQKWMRAVLPGVIGMERSKRKRALKAYAQTLTTLVVTLATADAFGLLEYAKRCEGAGDRALQCRCVPRVVIPHRTEFAKDAKEAKAWCKANKWEVPKGELITMVNYWRQNIKGK